MKNAQEAHEAIRPTLPLRSPETLRGELNATEMNVYRLIWQRTLGSQMGDAQGTTLMLRLSAQAPTTEPADCEVQRKWHHHHVCWLSRRLRRARRRQE